MDTNAIKISQVQVEPESCLIISSKLPIPIVCVFNDSLAYICSEDDADFNAIHGLVKNTDLSGDEMDKEEEL